VDVTPELPADAVPHWDLCKKYDLIDFELGVKLQVQVFLFTKEKVLAFKEL